MYGNTLLYDTDYTVTLRGGRNNERFSELLIKASFKTVHPIWSLILSLGQLEVQHLLHDSFSLLAKEIGDQYAKKMEIIRDFALEEDEEAYQAVLDAANNKNNPAHVIEQANYDL